MNKTLITLVAPSHNEEWYKCSLVPSLLAQSDPNWKAIIINNGPNDNMKKWITDLNDSRIVYENSDTDTGMWGTQNRQNALTYMVDTPYIIQTSIQDYWLPNAIAELNNVVAQEADMVTYQAMNHLFRYGILTGEIAYGHLDWGQVCVRTELMKETGIKEMDKFSSDWFTFQAILQTGKVGKIHKIEKILTIHN